jgi:Uma2 family endonuclease
MPTRVILTYRDYEALPADGRRYELHEGELSVTAAPAPRHQRILVRLLRVLDPHVRARGLRELLPSPIDLILSDTTIVQPDLVYLRHDQGAAVTDRGIETPPALVIEILSPGTAPIDRGVKLQLYERHGIPHYWIVDPEGRRIEAYELAGGVYRLAAALGGAAPALVPFPDFPLDPAAICA